MGKIDLTYINKQIAAKKAAEVEEKAAEAKKAKLDEKELFGETYEEFHNRLEMQMEEARKAIRAMKEMGF